MRTKFYLVRHAEAEGNANRVFHGWTDSDITAKGHKQAKLVAERLKSQRMDVLYSSSMTRTVRTAEYISEVQGLPIIKTDALKEINGGEWEGLSWSELSARYPKHYDTWENMLHTHVMPGGESIEEFQRRLLCEFESIKKKNEGKNICIVTHGTAIRVLLSHFYGCGLPGIHRMPWVDNTAVTIVEHEKGSFNILTAGDSSHLPKELSTIRNQDWYEQYIKNNRGVLQNE